MKEWVIWGISCLSMVLYFGFFLTGKAEDILKILPPKIENVMRYGYTINQTDLVDGKGRRDAYVCKAYATYKDQEDWTVTLSYRPNRKAALRDCEKWMDGIVKAIKEVQRSAGR